MLPGLDKQFVLKCIHPKDLLNSDVLATPCDVEGLAARAELVLKYGFAALKVDKLLIKGNAALTVRSTPHLIVLRALNSIIRRATRVRPADRDTIVRQLDTVLREGVQHRIYKFDIRSFFESVDRVHLFNRLALVPAIPRSALVVLQNLFNEYSARNFAGLPRGIQLSATLAEFALHRFDAEISSLPDVYFHARYVDDIVIVTGAREDPAAFDRLIRRRLPLGLSMNSQKTKRLDLEIAAKGQPIPSIRGFDYLGYAFSIHPAVRGADRRFSRKVDLGMATNKVKRTKSRICVAISKYANERDANKLERRLQMLTGNYKFREYSSGKERSVGLYCNYKRVNSYDSLNELDAFLRSTLVGNKGRVAHRFSQAAALSLRRRLLKYSFAVSFKRRVYYNFSADELSGLRRCWQNA